MVRVRVHEHLARHCSVRRDRELRPSKLGHFKVFPMYLVLNDVGPQVIQLCRPSGRSVVVRRHEPQHVALHRVFLTRVQKPRIERKQLFQLFLNYFTKCRKLPVPVELAVELVADELLEVPVCKWCRFKVRRSSGCRRSRLPPFHKSPHFLQKRSLHLSSCCTGLSWPLSCALRLHLCFIILFFFVFFPDFHDGT